MGTPQTPSRGVRFGAFEFDRKNGQLCKHGRKLKLRDQPLQVLANLLEQPGELVTREELQKKLWPEDTFVDFDNSLNTAIARLREVLGDSAHHPRFIETIPRRGYRFFFPVERQSSAPQAPVSRRLLAWAALLTIAAVGAAIWLWPTSQEVVESPRESPLTTYPGIEREPCFSLPATRSRLAGMVWAKTTSISIRRILVLVNRSA